MWENKKDILVKRDEKKKKRKCRTEYVIGYWFRWEKKKLDSFVSKISV
jgi:hypothetical protein